MTWWIILIIVIAGLALLYGLWYIATYNSLVRLKNDIDEAFSTMDVSMKKRFDLVPNLVATVKGYIKHESETLKAVTDARASVANAKSSGEKLKAQNQMTTAITNLFAVAESYPELKANANFIDLQGQLSHLETEIANSRKYYNACVKTYNTRIQVFPSSIVARGRGFEKATLYELENKAERKNVKVEF